MARNPETKDKDIDHTRDTKPMDWDEYFEFLRQYWEIFGPPPEPPRKPIYKKVLL